MAVHSLLHLPRRISNGVSNQAGILVFLHTNIRVIGPHVRYSSFRWGRSFIDKPLVDNTLSRINSITWCDRALLTRQGIVWIDAPFIILAVLKTHRVHRCIIARQSIDEQDLNHVSNFGTKSWPQKTLPWRLR